MQFVKFCQFFFEQSNHRIWMLAIWQKKVTDAGNLAIFLFTSASGNLSNLAILNLSNLATINLSKNTAIYTHGHGR